MADIEDAASPEGVELAAGLRISDRFCAVLEDEKTVVAADLHLGFEAVAASDGAYFPRRQKPMLLRRLGAILEKHRPELFIIAGDFKHNFNRNLRQEMDEVEEVLDLLSSRTDVAVVRGNHDNFLRSILAEGTPFPESLEIGQFVVSHGHKEPGPGGVRNAIRIIAHEHPSLKMRDQIGAQASAPAFLWDELSQTLVLPALSPLARGTDILGGRFISPVVRRMDRGLMRIFAVTGTGLLDFGAAGKIG